MSPRSLIVAALVLVCAFAATFAAASAVDTSFGSPAAVLQSDAWPSLGDAEAHSIAAEVLSRHQEFLFAELSATGATGVASSSTGSPQSSTGSPAQSSTGAPAESSTGPSSGIDASTGVAQPYNVTVYAPATVSFELAYTSLTVPPTLDADFAEAIHNSTGHPRELISASHFFETIPVPRRRAALDRRMRRAAGDLEVTKMTLTITPKDAQDATASLFATVISEQLACTDTPNGATKEECAQAAAARGQEKAAELGITLPEPVTVGATMFSSPVVAAAAAVIEAGSLEVKDGETTVLIDPNADNGHLIPSSGTARDTNIGYYVLGAVLAFFAAVALVYFIAHKAPVTKQTPEVVERRAPAAVALEEIPRSSAVPVDAVAVPVAADAAASSGVQTVEEPAAGQMDYKSVFALKHNVLDKKEDDATAAAPADDNDVHFVLHQ